MVVEHLSSSASGHVYVAKTLATGKKVAIKEMDLSHQPRKELIVNEILVMKESQHPNIVNFLESYLVKNNELWVVMEYMEGGALNVIIENNNHMEEDQISSICLEVTSSLVCRVFFGGSLRLAVDLQRVGPFARATYHSP
jgi:serine/threonine-protein kinase CLA4